MRCYALSHFKQNILFLRCPVHKRCVKKCQRYLTHDPARAGEAENPSRSLDRATRSEKEVKGKQTLRLNVETSPYFRLVKGLREPRWRVLTRLELIPPPPLIIISPDQGTSTREHLTTSMTSVLCWSGRRSWHTQETQNCSGRVAGWNRLRHLVLSRTL